MQILFGSSPIGITYQRFETGLHGDGNIFISRFLALVLVGTFLDNQPSLVMEFGVLRFEVLDEDLGKVEEFFLLGAGRSRSRGSAGAGVVGWKRVGGRAGGCVRAVVSSSSSVASAVVGGPCASLRRVVMSTLLLSLIHI